jgi:oligopeptide/dipeptide ABC transporter ATP-binding protein
MGRPVNTEPLLVVDDLQVHFPLRDGPFAQRRAVKALDGVSLTVGRREVVGVVGESGSGKTTVGRAILKLIAPTGGSIAFDGRPLGGLSARHMIPLRRRMQIIFQDPSASLNPAMTVGDMIGEALHLHKIGDRRDRPQRIGALLDRVGLPASAARRHPRELSGGQRQRVGIARALSVGPEFIVADEAVSALDVSVQAQIVNLLQDLQADLGLAILFIGHDLSLIEVLCERVVVLYLGRVMETGTAAELYGAPKHPYTRALLDAAPVIDPARRRERTLLKGETPSPISPPSGCVFRTRCPYAIDRCGEERPPLETVSATHAVACIRQAELSL